MKIAAIMGGGDWADASVKHVVLLKDTSLEELNKEYRKWYNDFYVPKLEPVQYLSFDEWLFKNNFARPTNDEELEEFWEI